MRPPAETTTLTCVDPPKTSVTVMVTGFALAFIGVTENVADGPLAVVGLTVATVVSLLTAVNVPV